MFPVPVVDDAALLTKRVELGEIAVFDPTLVTNRPVCKFDDAVRVAREKLADLQQFRCVIDVERSRRGGIRPLPIRADGVFVDDRSAQLSAPDQPTIELPRGPAVDHAETPATRIDRWKRRLLDLSNRNRLLSFKETKKSVPLASSKLAGIEDALADGRTLILRPALTEQRLEIGRPVASETVDALLDQELDAGNLITKLAAEVLDTRLTEIFRSAREGLEEGGASGLYIALGFLEWFESATSDRPRRAPLILVPIDLQRGSIRQGFKLTRAADETRFNSTLVEMLSTQHNVQITGVEPLPEDEHGIDVIGILQRVRATIRDVPRWRVLDEAYVGFFTFAKFLMWKDLDKQSNILLQNGVVAHLVHEPGLAFDPDWRAPDYATQDDFHPTLELHCAVPSDSSQLAAVIAAGQGKSFVLEGPPGTGKSQTITNVIAHCLALGKTVLFVSEKTAALNVVFDRLKRIGLQRFCLELHSNKANKAEVVHRLGEALSAARERTPEDWSRVAAQLDTVRSELNAYARAIGRAHSNGLSVFRATSLLTAVRDAPFVNLGWGDIGSVDRQRLDEARNTVREASNALRVAGEPYLHPLEGIGIEDAAPGVAERIRQAIAIARTSIAGIAAVGGTESELSVDLETASRCDLQLLATACDAIVDAPPSGAALIAVEEEEAVRGVSEVCTLGRSHDSLRASLAATFDVRILDSDLIAIRASLREAEESWIVSRWMKTRVIRRNLLGVAKPRRVLTLAEMQAGIETALRLRDVQRRLAKALADFSVIAGSSWREDEAPWNAIERVLTWVKQYRTKIRDDARGSRLANEWAGRVARCLAGRGTVASARQVANATREGVRRLLDATDGVAGVLQLEADDPFKSPTAPAFLNRSRERFSRVENGLPQLRQWALWRRIRKRMRDQSLSALTSAIERGAFRSDQLEAAFDRSFYESWLAWARAQEPVLRDFIGLSHDQRIADFRTLDERCTELVRRVVASKLSARVPSVDVTAVPGSELGVLRRQLQLQRRHLGPRQLFQQTRSIVQKLKPCFLMSPISVAQYLPPGEMSFDIVVFDEASQIPTWDAVGAIARGAQAVVVGDSKQLPPTSFFDVVVEDEELDFRDIEELESILDECRAAGVPALDLRWHYRSRHESLITFSNRRYYQNRLSTFPAAHVDGLGVQWRHVPAGSYARGRTRTNRGEADALVAEILRRLRDPELSRYSMGVVTFSAAQQLLVEDLLDDERRKDPGLDDFFIASDARTEPVFVKNLENVQGDERDVILFSICYGPDETGRVAMTFGPLTKQGGERRLNVAITRARRELIVFSTLTADQIDLARTRASGVADLKLFLSYAQHGVRVLPAESSISQEDHFDSPLEQEICEALRRKGYTVHTQVGCSGYRIDLAVVDPDRPGSYLVGIECDGANYHSARTARDRDRLRESVLRDLGWKLFRVWSSDWWEARDQQLERLCSGIEDARRLAISPPSPPRESRSAPPGPRTTPATVIEGSVTLSSSTQLRAIEPKEVLPRYVVRPARRIGSQEDFYDPLKSQRVIAELKTVVTAEGPISVALAASRVTTSFGFERTRRGAVDRIYKLALQARIPITQQEDAAILWPASMDPNAWREFRTSEASELDVRSSVDLPRQEIANAAEYLLKVNGACPRWDLHRALSRLFGYKARGSTVVMHLDRGIDYLISSGRARVDGDRLIATTGQ